MYIYYLIKKIYNQGHFFYCKNLKNKYICKLLIHFTNKRVTKY